MLDTETAPSNKRCSTCKTEKLVTEFTRNRSTRDGLHNQCRVCKQVWHDANPDKQLLYSKKWKDSNPELLKESRVKWKSEDREEYPRKVGACSYQAAHVRVRYNRGSASSFNCIDCGATACEWSYNHASDRELTQTVKSSGWGSRKVSYSPNPFDYDPRCKSCHIKFDFYHAGLTSNRPGGADK